MDECDMGSATAAKHLQDALAGHKSRANSFRKSRTHCLDCEQEIPEARRRVVAGCERCIDCQTHFEKATNGY